MKNGKRVVSLLLSVMLSVSVLFIGVSAEDEYVAGDLVTFGTYPQSMVTDEQLIAELNSLSLDWVSYGYYYWSYSGGVANYFIKSVEKDWMKYVDIEHNGGKYRGVLIEQYRQLMNPHYEDITSQKELGFELNKIYWFKYEPLVWRVVDSDEGILISEYVIDSQQMNESYYYSHSADEANSIRYTDTGEKILAHVGDYSQSSLRIWLNETFVKTAFSHEEQELLMSRELNNQATDFCGEIFDYSFSNKNYYRTTNDKVSLLSVGELIEWSENIGTLEADSTEYSYSQGRQSDTPEWTLRTPIVGTLEYANTHNVNPLFVGCGNHPALRVYKELSWAEQVHCGVCQSKDEYPLYMSFFYQIPALRPVIKIDLVSAELPKESTTEEPTTEEPTTEEPTTEEPTTEEPTTEEPTTEEPPTGNDGESFFARLWDFLVKIVQFVVNTFKNIFGIE